MNERIRELAVEAGLLPREIGPVVETRHMKKKEQDLKKFAELIVKECRDMFVVNSPSWNLLNEKIEHFGVEA